MPYATNKGAGKPTHLYSLIIAFFAAYNSSADGVVAPFRESVKVTHMSRSQAFHQYLSTLVHHLSNMNTVAPVICKY